MEGLSALDLVTVGVYAIGILVLGIWAGRRERGAEEFFLAGRTLSWPLIGLSYYASNMSGASFVGLTAAAYAYGIAVFNYEWTATLVLIVFALFVLPVFLRSRLFTVPEYLERRFDARARRAYSAFTIVAVLLIDTAGALYAGGLVVSTALPGFSLIAASIVLGLIAGFYTISGGLRAVVVTDAVQGVLILLGGAVILFVGLDAVGGWDQLMAGLDPERRRLFRAPDDVFLPWPGIFGVILLGFYYWALNQYFVQRALAARSLAHGRRGALFGGLLKLPNLFIVVVPGLIAYRLFPELEHADLAFPMLAFELLPAGLRGLVLTAVVAAIMSSLDSALNAAASLFTMDFVAPLRPGLPQRTLVVLGRSFTAATLGLALLYLPVIREFTTLFEYFQSTLAYITPPVVAVYALGLTWPRATAAGAVYGLCGGVAVGLLFFIAGLSGLSAQVGLPEVHFTYVAIGMFGFTAALTAIKSLLDTPPATRPDAAMIRRSDVVGKPGARGAFLEAGIVAILLAATIAACYFI